MENSNLNCRISYKTVSPATGTPTMALGSSSFRRSGQRDDRRRRLLTDELTNSEEWPASHPHERKGEKQAESCHYGRAEFLEQQLRVLDLVPRRILVLLPLALATAAAIAGVEFAYFFMLEKVSDGLPMIGAFDLATKGSLGGWFGSLLLLATSAMAVLVFMVRRHRIDDYQGRYRIWLWAAAACFLMAADQATNLRDGFRQLMVAWTTTPLMGDGSLWWVMVYVVATAAVGSRLLIDMRSSPFSVATLALAVLTHTAVVAACLGWIPLPDGGCNVMLRAGGEMTGNLLLLVAITVFARHVLLDAEGLLPHHDAEIEEESEEEEAEDAGDEENETASTSNHWRQVDPPHPTPQPTFQRVSTPAVTSSVAASVPPTLNRKLTKGEKKALKERLLRERQERERKGLN